jgi:2-iminobutanoate/2-iminopropanoate deaminase
MKLQGITGEKVPKAKSKISQAVKAGDLIYLSGQTGVDPLTGQVREGIKNQTRQVFANIEAVLQAAGSSIDRIIYATVFLSDMNDWSAYNEVWGEIFARSEPCPARSTVQVAGLLGGIKIEIQVVAAS